MVVIAIIGLGMLVITPIVSNRVAEGDEQIHFFTQLLEEHLQWAEEEGAPVTIVGFKGSGNILKYDGTRVTIPGVRSIQSAHINDELTEGVEYHITVYPDRICDHFLLESDRLLFESSPLLMQVTKRPI